jgi:hypothetical protein
MENLALSHIFPFIICQKLRLFDKAFPWGAAVLAYCNLAKANSRERKGFQSGSRSPFLSLSPYAGCCRCRLHPKAAGLSTSPLPATPHTASSPQPRLRRSVCLLLPLSLAGERVAAMSGLYSQQGFSPARNLSPQIRSNPDVDR